MGRIDDISIGISLDIGTLKTDVKQAVDTLNSIEAKERTIPVRLKVDTVNSQITDIRNKLQALTSESWVVPVTLTWGWENGPPPTGAMGGNPDAGNIRTANQARSGGSRASASRAVTPAKTATATPATTVAAATVAAAATPAATPAAATPRRTVVPAAATPAATALPGTQRVRTPPTPAVRQQQAMASLFERVPAVKAFSNQVSDREWAGIKSTFGDLGGAVEAWQNPKLPDDVRAKAKSRVYELLAAAGKMSPTALQKAIASEEIDKPGWATILQEMGLAGGGVVGADNGRLIRQLQRSFPKAAVLGFDALNIRPATQEALMATADTYASRFPWARRTLGALMATTNGLMPGDPAAARIRKGTIGGATYPGSSQSVRHAMTLHTKYLESPDGVKKLPGDWIVDASDIFAHELGHLTDRAHFGVGSLAGEYGARLMGRAFTDYGATSEKEQWAELFGYTLNRGAGPGTLDDYLPGHAMAYDQFLERHVGDLGYSHVDADASHDFLAQMLDEHYRRDPQSLGYRAAGGTVVLDPGKGKSLRLRGSVARYRDDRGKTFRMHLVKEDANNMLMLSTKEAGHRFPAGSINYFEDSWGDADVNPFVHQAYRNHGVHAAGMKVMEKLGFPVEDISNYNATGLGASLGHLHTPKGSASWISRKRRAGWSEDDIGRVMSLGHLARYGKRDAYNDAVWTLREHGIDIPGVDEMYAGGGKYMSVYKGGSIDQSTDFMRHMTNDPLTGGRPGMFWSPERDYASKYALAEWGLQGSYGRNSLYIQRMSNDDYYLAERKHAERMRARGMVHEGVVPRSQIGRSIEELDRYELLGRDPRHVINRLAGPNGPLPRVGGGPATSPWVRRAQEQQQRMGWNQAGYRYDTGWATPAAAPMPNDPVVAKLIAMASQSVSPNEADVARRMLHKRGVPGYASGGYLSAPARYWAAGKYPPLARHPGAVLVNERGPEEMLTASGKMFTIHGGPQVIVPSEPGMILSNHTRHLPLRERIMQMQHKANGGQLPHAAGGLGQQLGRQAGLAMNAGNLDIDDFLSSLSFASQEATRLTPIRSASLMVGQLAAEKGPRGQIHARQRFSQSDIREAVKAQNNLESLQVQLSTQQGRVSDLLADARALSMAYPAASRTPQQTAEVNKARAKVRMAIRDARAIRGAIPAATAFAQNAAAVASISTLGLNATVASGRFTPAQIAPAQAAIQAQMASGVRPSTSLGGVLQKGDIAKSLFTGAASFMATSIAWTAAMGVVNKGLQLFGTAIDKSADQMMGFAQTADKWGTSMAEVVQGKGMASGAALSGFYAQAGISGSLLGNLSERAKTLAGANAFAQQTEMLRADQSLGNQSRGRGIWEATGNGMLPGTPFSWIGQTPSINESLAGSLTMPGVNKRDAAGNYGGAFGRSAQDIAAMEQQNGLFGYIAANFYQGWNALAGGALINQGGMSQADALAQSMPFIANANEQAKKAQGAQLVHLSGDDLAKSTAAIATFDTNLATKLNALGLGLAEGTADAAKAYLEAIDQGSNMISIPEWIQANKVQMQAQIRDIGRQTAFAQTTSIPASFAANMLANPLSQSPSQGLFVPGAGGEAGRSAWGKYGSQIRAARKDLVAFQDEGLKALDDLGVPPKAISDVKELGADIRSLKDSAANLQLGLEQEQWNRQMFVSKRALGDLIGLQGKQSVTVSGMSIQATKLGRLQREQLNLERESSQVALARNRRELEFQIALSRINTPGATPEERATRAREADLLAQEQSKQLNRDERLRKIGIQIQDIGITRDAQDAIWELGHAVKEHNIEFQVKGLSSIIDAKQSMLDVKMQFLDSWKSAGESIKRAGMSAVAAAEAATGDFSGAVGREVDKALNGTGKEAGLVAQFKAGYNDLLQYVQGHPLFPSLPGGPGGETPPAHNGQRSGGRFASGVLGTVSSETHMTVGEAGKETVAVLRNPRAMLMRGMGGGGYVFNLGGITINGSVDSDQRVRQIADAVERRLHQRAALVGSMFDA